MRRRRDELSRQEIARYARHLVLPEVAIEGQRRLKGSSVLLVGAGGLGSPAALYLAAAGVGRIGIVDFDVVDESNLQRQILHDTSWVGRPKLESAVARLAALNPHVRVEPHADGPDPGQRPRAPGRLRRGGRRHRQLRDPLPHERRLLLPRRSPTSTARSSASRGRRASSGPTAGPATAASSREPPPPGLVPSCAEGGVLGILPGVIGGIQATEALKILLGVGEPLVGRLLLYDALAMRFDELKLRRDPDCPLCSPKATIRELQDYPAFCGTATGPGGGAGRGDRRPRAEAPPRRGRAARDHRRPRAARVGDLPDRGGAPRAAGVARRAPRTSSTPRAPTSCSAGRGCARPRRWACSAQAGFRHLLNLRGGILAWAREVDPSMPTY